MEQSGTNWIRATLWGLTGGGIWFPAGPQVHLAEVSCCEPVERRLGGKVAWRECLKMEELFRVERVVSSTEVGLVVRVSSSCCLS